MKYIIALALIFTIGITPVVASAQWTQPPGPTYGLTTFQSTAQRATNIALLVVASLSVIFLVYGAIQYVTSRGDTQAAEKAKGTITYAIVGIVIAILAYAIVNITFNLVTDTSQNQGNQGCDCIEGNQIPQCQQCDGECDFNNPFDPDCA
jgi:uncharacterized membrane protein